MQFCRAKVQQSVSNGVVVSLSALFVHRNAQTLVFQTAQVVPMVVLLKNWIGGFLGATGASISYRELFVLRVNEYFCQHGVLKRLRALVRKVLELFQSYR